MSALVAVLILILLGFVVLLVSAPLRTAHSGEQSGSLKSSGEEPSETPGRILLDDLEAAREAKYREIRDAEMDFRTGKLSHEDYEATDAQLRAEALEILNRLESDPATAESPAGADRASE